jgi:2'-5' RNA ligase
MPFAVTLRLDPASATQAAGIQRALAEAGLSDLPSLGYPPHVTLAVLPDPVDAGALLAAVGSACRGWSRLPVRLPGLGIFPGGSAVLWLSVAAEDILPRRQAALRAALGERQVLQNYRAGQWMPHVTLAEDLTEAGLSTAIQVASRGWIPIDGWLDRVEVVRFRPVSVLWSVVLAETLSGPGPSAQAAKPHPPA